MATPGRPPGQPHTGGRKPGTPNKNQLTEEMRKSIVSVFRRMGGTKWLLTWAKENETEFVRLVLTRILPAPPKEEPLVEVNISAQAATLTDVEAATRIAFALAKATQGDDTPPTRTIEAMPEAVAASELPTLPSMEPEQHPDVPTGEVYRGSRLEQGRERPGRSVRRKRDLL